MATLIKRRQADGSMSYRVQDRTTGYPSLSKTFPTLKSAREFLRKVEVERQEGLAGLKRGRQRLVDAVSDYTQTADYRTRKAGSHTTTHLKWWSDSIGNLPLSSITPELVADHLHRLEAGSLSGSTVNRYRSALSGLFRYAIQVRHWTDHNPCRMVERRKEGNPRERVLTPKEWQALLDAAYAAKAATKENPRTDRIYSPLAQIANMLRLSYATAARRADIYGLRWEYVNLEAKTVTFHNPKSGDAYTLPLFGDALKAMKEQAKIQREACPWVFPAPTGRNDVPTNFDSAFQTIRKAAGLDGLDAKGEKLVLHSLRHSAATEAGRAGASSFEVQAMTGHKTLAMVQRYTKVGQENALQAMKKRAKA